MNSGAKHAKSAVPVKIIDTILRAEHLLLQSGIKETVRLEAEILLADLLGIERTKLIASFSDYLDKANLAEYYALIKRRMQGEPIAYITGKKEFMGLVFTVDNRTLIPRPETETLVEHLIEILKAERKTGNCILEIGTGCGCIAISLAHHLPEVSVNASDISREAIELATQNALAHGTSQKVGFYYGNVYSAFPESLRGTVKVIVSNPPYISDSEYLQLDRGIRDFEPSLALKGGTDGMNVIRHIATGAAAFLDDDGLLAMEIGETQAESSREILESTRSFASTEIVHDLSGRPRVIIGRKK